MHCPFCAADNRTTARFCDACGSALSAVGTESGDVRKLVTILFADLCGSTTLQERLDVESVRGQMERYYARLHHIVEKHRGRVVKFTGDGVMAAFGVPRTEEDDALRAVRAGVEMQRAVGEFDGGDGAVLLAVRVGINSGELVVGHSDADLFGDPVNVAARLEQSAPRGGVLVGEATARLLSGKVTLEPFGLLTLKGRAQSVVAHRVVSPDPPSNVPSIQFVGREEELQQALALFESVAGAAAVRTLTILGSPGIGKSRLLSEILHRIGGGAACLSASCDAAGGATFAPLGDALRRHLALAGGAPAERVREALSAAIPLEDSSRIVDGLCALLAGAPPPPEETFFVVRRFLSITAQSLPVVLALDDVQWAEPLLLDLVEHLVEWSADTPLLILMGARPELRDQRPSLAEAGEAHSVITLGGLGAAAAARLAAAVAGAPALPAAIELRVLAAGEGNPLFVGEIVRMLIADGTLAKDGERWSAGSTTAAIEIPPTIQALLGARIERLPREERLILETAAVIGMQFTAASVAELLPPGVSTLGACLESLRRAEILDDGDGWVAGEPAMRFRHVLFRDAAYRRVLKGSRAELHTRFADWLAARSGKPGENDDVLGWHLEQACRSLRDLGPVDEQGRQLGRRACAYLAASGRRALARDDVRLAAGLLDRAVSCLESEDPERADFVLDLCEALLAGGDVAIATQWIAELGRLATGSSRLLAWHTCFTGQLTALTDPRSLHATVAAVAEAAAEFARLGDSAAEAKAFSVQAQALARLGQVGACESNLDKALAAARRAGDRRRANAVLAGAPLAALWGPSPITRASGRCLDVVRVLRITQGSPVVEAIALNCQGVLEALRGRSEAARRMVASSRALVEELGITHRLLEADVCLGRIELLEGNAVAAERWLRGAYDGLRDLGLDSDAAQAAALLGRALLTQGRNEEAESLSHESEALAGDDLQAAIAWRGVRAMALARRGEHEAAVELAEAAVAIASGTDALLDHADARLSLAAALRAASRTTEAGAEERRARELWEAKGATLLAQSARPGSTPIAFESASSYSLPISPSTAGNDQRRLRPNSASTASQRLAAAMDVRDIDASADALGDRVIVIDHPTGVTYGRSELLDSLGRFFRERNPEQNWEVLATLGDSFGVGRRLISSNGTSGGRFDVGPYERLEYVLGESDDRGRLNRLETFADDRLGDAIVRLYELYAKSLPEGPARRRAERTAQSLPGVELRFLRSFAATLSPDIEFVDHRILGLGSGSGAPKLLRSLDALDELCDDVVATVLNVLAAEPDALLIHVLTTGRSRATGGRFDMTDLFLWQFDENGLFARYESFDGSDEAAALARFDELTLQDTAPRRRVVRSTASSLATEHWVEAFAAGDLSGLNGYMNASMKVIDHPTGATYRGDHLLDSLQRLLRTQKPKIAWEILATLGETLTVGRRLTSASGVQNRQFDVGAYEHEDILIFSTEPPLMEAFAVDKLGDAIIRMYELYSTVLPEGPARLRAERTARSVPAIDFRYTERFPAALSPAVEFIDHRTLCAPSGRGADRLLRGLGAMNEASDDVVNTATDILALEPSGLLVHVLTSGKVHATGGGFEIGWLFLAAFDQEGKIARFETFDEGEEAAALARFEDLGRQRSPLRRLRETTARTVIERLDKAFAEADMTALQEGFSTSLLVVEHPNGATYGYEGQLASLRRMLRCREPRQRATPLVALGDSLLLCSRHIAASGTTGGHFDVGGFDRHELVLFETDANTKICRFEVFGAERLAESVTRLYERHAELLPEGRARRRATTIARSLPDMDFTRGIDRFMAGISQTVEFVDHRTLGFASGQGARKLLRGFQALTEMLDDVVNIPLAVLAAEPALILVHMLMTGKDRAGGGSVESPMLLLWAFDSDGLVDHYETFNIDDADRALARFEELLGRESGADRLNEAHREDASPSSDPPSRSLP